MYLSEIRDVVREELQSFLEDVRKVVREELVREQNREVCKECGQCTISEETTEELVKLTKKMWAEQTTADY